MDFVKKVSPLQVPPFTQKKGNNSYEFLRHSISRQPLKQTQNYFFTVKNPNTEIGHHSRNRL